MKTKAILIMCLLFSTTIFISCNSFSDCMKVCTLYKQRNISSCNYNCGTDTSNIGLWTLWTCVNKYNDICNVESEQACLQECKGA